MNEEIKHKISKLYNELDYSLEYLYSLEPEELENLYFKEFPLD